MDLVNAAQRCDDVEVLLVRMGVIKNQFWKMPDGNRRQDYAQDHEHPDGS